MVFRRRTRRMSRMAPVIQSYKKVLNFAPASRLAATDIPFLIAVGADSIAAGQTGVTDNIVPTGCIIKFVEIQFSVENLLSTACFQHICIQHLRATQSAISPLVVGGNPQRNQVHYQLMFSIGEQQNSNHVWRFKIPKKYQRVREGDAWTLTTNASGVTTSACQMIYKFYR